MSEEDSDLAGAFSTVQVVQSRLLKPEETQQLCILLYTRS